MVINMKAIVFCKPKIFLPIKIKVGNDNVTRMVVNNKCIFIMTSRIGAANTIKCIIKHFKLINN